MEVSFPGVLLSSTQPLSLSHARMSPEKIKNSLRLLTDPHSLLIRMKGLRMFQKERQRKSPIPRRETYERTLTA